MGYSCNMKYSLNLTDLCFLYRFKELRKHCSSFLTLCSVCTETTMPLAVFMWNCESSPIENDGCVSCACDKCRFLAYNYRVKFDVFGDHKV